MPGAGHGKAGPGTPTFDDGNLMDNSTGFNYSTSPGSIQNNYLAISNSDLNPVFGNRFWNNITVQFALNATPSAGIAAAMVMFNNAPSYAADSTLKFEASSLGNTSTKFFIYKNSNVVNSTLYPVNFVNAWNNYTMNFSFNTLDVYVNGVPVLSNTDASLTGYSGYLAIYTVGGANNKSFDNITVRPNRNYAILNATISSTSQGFRTPSLNSIFANLTSSSTLKTSRIRTALRASAPVS